MDTDLDLLLTIVYCLADDFLPNSVKNASRKVTDAEIVTLCVAQAIMGIPGDDRFIRTADYRLRHLFPRLPSRDAFHKRRIRCTEKIEALIGHFARHSPGFEDDMLLVDSTPIECARSLETVKRGGSSSLNDALANAADYGYCASHSRLFWGFRLHAVFAPDGTPRALALTSPKIDEKIVLVSMIARLERRPGQLVALIGDKNFRGRTFEAELATLDASIHRPRRKDETGPGPHLAPIRQRIESIFWTFKDLLTLERHGARTLGNLRARLCARFAALAACVMLNHQLGRPTRSLAPYVI
jgi:hypothetical protein